MFLHISVRRMLRIACAAALLAIGTVRAADAPSPPPTDKAAAPAPTLAQRGEYLARIGNCISCHTRHGGEPFAGGLIFTAPYTWFGALYSTNITPDRASGIGDWTEEQFVRALREGRSPRHGGLFPAFPYTAFTLVTDNDAKAIFAYLRTIKPVKYAPPDNSGAFNLRWGMAVWNALFFDARRFEPDSKQSAEWNRGAYLVNGLGHCGACHTPRNVFLAERGDAALSGGAYPEFLMPGKNRDWYAVNLTSAAGGLKAWSEDDIKKYLKTGHSRRAGIFGPMNEVVINSLQYLTDEDAKAMAVYLKSLPAQEDAAQEPIAATQLQAGAKVYADTCEECHRSSGRGAFLKAPPLVGSAVVQGKDPSTLINVILHGAAAGEGAPTPFGAWENMKSLGSKLTDEQVAAVSNYVRGSWGNRGGAVTAADVAKQR